MLHLSGLHLEMIEEEVEDQKNHPTILHDLWQYIDFEALQDTTSTIDPAFVETKETSIKKLLPGAYDLGAHIPGWMPAFPPEHTFRATPYHPNRVTNPRVLREMIVKEGQLAEQALRRLTGVVKVDDNAELVEDQDEDEDKEKEIGDENEDVDMEDDAKRSASNEKETYLAEKKEASNEMGDDLKTKPTLSLKLSLGPTSTAETAPVISVGGPTPAVKVSKDPLGLKVGLKKPFDIVDYMQKRVRQQVKRRSKQEAKSRREEHRRRVLNWHAALIESSSNTTGHKLKARGASNISNKDDYLTKLLKLEPEEEDHAASGFGPAPGVVEKEYNAALLWISKAKKEGQQKSDIADTGIVNCEQNKYMY